MWIICTESLFCTGRSVEHYGVIFCDIKKEPCVQDPFDKRRMPLAGLEPARIAPLDFESSASANSATAA